MRVLSTGFSGLWSAESAIALPPLSKIARESPMFAHNSSLLRKFTATTQAVEPMALKGCSTAGKSPPNPQEPWRNLVSSLGSASSKARNMHGFCASATSCSLPQASTSEANNFAANAETSLPPWPSKIANNAVSGKMAGSRACATCASSMASRQPRMPHATQPSWFSWKLPVSQATFLSGVGPIRNIAIMCLSTAWPTNASAPYMAKVCIAAGAKPSAWFSTHSKPHSAAKPRVMQDSKKGHQGDNACNMLGDARGKGPQDKMRARCLNA
mmetsp:Transcript_147563/g.374853  ORF Transcript_147563/g.374853 Transcript_147563/m.374853 type:complete len:270 (+) Transcript_147563:601-1410(+)